MREKVVDNYDTRSKIKNHSVNYDFFYINKNVGIEKEGAKFRAGLVPAETKFIYTAIFLFINLGTYNCLPTLRLSVSSISFILAISSTVLLNFFAIFHKVSCGLTKYITIL